MSFLHLPTGIRCPIAGDASRLDLSPVGDSSSDADAVWGASPLQSTAYRHE
jgi:hypothetical protein